MPARALREILDTRASFAPDDWRSFAREIHFPLPGEFDYFVPDEETGLPSDEVNPAYVESKRRTRPICAFR